MSEPFSSPPSGEDQVSMAVTSEEDECAEDEPQLALERRTRYTSSSDPDDYE
jgi:hypothetical protein